MTLVYLGGRADAEPESGSKMGSLVEDRLAAEDLEKEHRWSGCGDAYRRMAKEYPSDPRVSELYYNAGVCYEHAGQVRDAIAMFRALERHHPKTREAQKALVRHGNDAGAIAEYADAADAYERYARRFAGEKDAARALETAAVYRIGTGANAHALRLTELWIKNYGQKSLESIWAHWRMQQLVKDLGASIPKQIDGLERLLRVRPKGITRTHAVVALAKLGHLYWQRACPARFRTKAGECRKPIRGGSRCARLPSEIVRRKPKLVAQARAHCTRATSMSRRLRSHDDDLRSFHLTRTAKYWSTGCELLLALAETGEHRGDWPHRLDEAHRRLAPIIAGGGPWAIEALARLGALEEQAGREIAAAAIVANASPQRREQICAAARARAPEFRARAIGAYTQCLHEANKTGVYSDASRRCLDRLDALEPKARVRERLPTAGRSTFLRILEPPELAVPQTAR